MYPSNENVERYRLREDLRRLGKLLDRHLNVPEPSAEMRELFRRLSEAEYHQKQRNGAAGSFRRTSCGA
jgi:hypothetical protein